MCANLEMANLVDAATTAHSGRYTQRPISQLDKNIKNIEKSLNVKCCDLLTVQSVCPMLADFNHFCCDNMTRVALNMLQKKCTIKFV
jgi:hypothetical protein